MANKVALRSNMTPAGGVVNPNPQALGTIQAQDALTQIMNYQAFTGASERNITKQEQRTLTHGQQTAIQIRNVGFLQSSLLKFSFSGNIPSVPAMSGFTGSNPAPSIDMVQFTDALPQIRNVCQSALTHNASALELIMLHNKKYGLFHPDKGQGIVNGTVKPQAVTLTNYVEYFINPYFSISSSRALYLFIDEGKVSVSVCAPSSITNVKVTVNLYVPIEFTFSKNSLFGLIPLQSNSVYDELSFTPRFDKVAGDDGSEFAFDDVNMSVALYNETWAVPISANAQSLYMPYISYNYLVNSLQETVTASGAKAFNYMIKSNMLLTSIILSARDAEDGNKLIRHADVFDKIYIDYNGSSFYEDVEPSVSNFYNTLNNGGNTAITGIVIKDFSQLDRNNNSFTWSNFLDMYQANSPRIVGDIREGFDTPKNIQVCYESLVPSTVSVIG